jgi:hypothetical protein
MATGTIWQPGGLAAPTDVVNEGVDQWAAMTGVSAKSPLVGGSAYRSDMPYNVDGSRSRVVTTGQGGPAMAPDAPGVRLLDDWRDALNPQSPAFWVLLLILGMLGLMQLRVQARAGKLRLGGGIG